MENAKFVKAKCSKTGLYFGLDVKQFGTTWKVVNMVNLTDEEARVTSSEVRQGFFETNVNLLPCKKCGSRRVGGCGCAPRLINERCSSSMDYNFQCVYCKHFEIDYSMPSAKDVEGYRGKTITLSQGKEFKVVTFSNVTWTKFDNIQNHPTNDIFAQIEPKIHVIANERNIEFHGYNVSQMDEGVYYKIGAQDDFSIECDVVTSTIQPHPGGQLYISFGAITANITEKGGQFLLNGRVVGQVGSKFHMALGLVNNVYSIVIDGIKIGELRQATYGEKKIVFGFAHGSHFCSMLSHAYLKNIQMGQGVQI